MKKILISIRPQWVAKILSGEKTIEVRKTAPKCELPCAVYIYCTKDNKQGLVWDDEGKGLINARLFPYAQNCPENHRLVNGKVVAKFTLKQVEGIYDEPIYRPCGECYEYEHATVSLNLDELCAKTCLDEEELADYLDEKRGYAWHIDDLVIFDKPKELGDFIDTDTPSYEQAKPFLEMFGKPYYKETYKESCERLGYTLRRPPQSWCYCEVAE